MRLGNALLFGSLLLLSTSAWAEGFLSKSRLLGAAGVGILPAQQTSDGLVLPVLESEHSEPNIFLTSQGNYALAPVPSGKERKLKVHACGGHETARPWKSSKPIKGRGYFIATGKGVDSLKLKWSAATKTSAPTGSKCLSHPGYRTSALSVARVNTLQENLFFAAFENPEAVRYEAAREKKKADEIATPPACEDYGSQRVGLLRGDECDVLLESKIDCDGRGYVGGTFGKPLGVLEISRGSESERWLVFEAFGYEGDAYLGIRLSTERPPLEKDIDFYVYSGC
jgi:hypothetical protein